MAKLEEQESLLAAEAPFSSFGEPSSQLSTDIAGPSSAISPASEWNPTSRGRRQAPHFSWAQTGDTVTIAFTLPPWITKSHIRAHFSLGALSVSFTQEALDLLNAPASAAITEIDTKVAGPSDANDELTNAARMIASGRYVSRSTWAEIDPTGSVWTVEKASKMSLLTLHLEKRHEGTRWMQVFANRTGTRPDRKRNFADSETMNRSTTKLSFPQARFKFESVATGRFGELDGDRYDEKEAEGEDAEDNEDDIPETMDPSELISMLEGMQKYTVDEESAQQGADYGFDRTGFTSSSVHGQNGGTSLSLDQPSLLKEGLEEEDANVGRDFVVSVISHSLSDSNEMHSSKSGEKIMLATGLPGNYCDMEAVVIKHDLDGAIFTLKAGQWKHVATMPALAFVLASKRDAQRVHLYQRRDKSGQEGEYAVLAFEGAPQVTGSGGSSAAAAGAGNLFVYYSPSSSGARHAPSRVVRLGATESANAARNGSEEGADAASGALLGVCSVRLSRAGSQSDGSVETMDETLVCLCENRILLLRGVL
ncbi:uncharacterized protein MEPE_00617 [Melanopsichium pennsylvanicum]|uniref:NudC domain-containing protein 1 n=2 Tax=Melanopsichium pennsylvanicum TaxID=63383 RepID=A0AAJ4XH00_9BASI|nr:uncharacterized protein MEPE_00617 [Melanopsichium pennsylvanicum]